MMRLPRFKYLAPKNLRDACQMLQDLGPEATIVAGGTDLFPKMKRRQMNYKYVIGLGKLGLRGLSGTPQNEMKIGALATLAELQETLPQPYSVISQAASLISTPIIQNMGTIGGNLCLDTRCNYYDQNYYWRKSIDFCMKKDGDICWVARSSDRCWAVSSCDLGPVVIALKSRLGLKNASGERVIDAEDLYANDGIKYLNKNDNEILTSVLLPQVNGWRATYFKLRRRGSFDFPVVSVAVCLWFERSIVTDARIVLGAVAARPLRVKEAETQLIGKPLTDETIQQAAHEAFVHGKPLDNTDLNMTWRKEMIKVYTKHALEKLK